jgi:hypothetical protein
MIASLLSLLLLVFFIGAVFVIRKLDGGKRIIG